MGENDGAPDDPFTAMTNAAVSIHEMYLAFVEAGFTNEQALRLVITAMGGAK